MKSIALRARGIGPTFALIAIVGLSGCAGISRSTYVRPTVPVNATWETRTVGHTLGSKTSWWNSFDDPQLEHVVQQVLQANPNLAAAGLRLAKARLSSNLAEQGLFPGVTGNLSSGATKTLTGTKDVWNSSSGASTAVSWELDLFGRLSAAASAADWESRATAQDLAETRLSLISTTVTTWWQLAYANEQIALGETSLAYSRKALDLVKRQFEAGASSQLQVRDAEQALASQQALQTQYVHSRVQAMKTLAALMASQSYQGTEPTTLPQGELPSIPEGVPAQLLSRRPDLAAAELRLRSTLAQSDATVASYYPRVSLTSSLGGSSTSLTGLFANPVAGISTLLSLAELNPKKVRLGIGVARTSYRIAAQQFRDTFYSALRDAQIALSAHEQYIAQSSALAANLAAAGEAERLYQRQYRAGAIALRPWLDAQERMRNARASVLQNRYNLLVSQVQVYQALGGDADTA